MEWIVLYATMLDIIIGDPRSLPHPVVTIGRVISSGEKIIRRYCTSPRALKWAGVVLVIIIVGGSWGFFWSVLWLAYKVNHVLGLGLSIILMSQALALNSLYKHSRAVAQPLIKGNLTAARQALAMIVGRDTDRLDENEIIRGTVESVAENTVDGIISPLFYGFIGGPALALTYKAINTLDSMIGYKDERYINLGWAAARLDDLANYIPARLTGLFFLILAPFTGGGWRGVWKSLRRDARQHPSPNGGFPEAAVAGALGVQLGGLNYYRGNPTQRALMGEKIRPLEYRDITRTLILMAMVSGEMLLLGISLRIFLR